MQDNSYFKPAWKASLSVEKESYRLSALILCCIIMMMMTLFLARWCEEEAKLKTVVEIGRLDEVLSGFTSFSSGSSHNATLQ